jgi:hypothetical protein
VDGDERTRFALRQLLECTGASGGVLFGMREGLLEPIAAAGADAAQTDLGQCLLPALRRRLAQELDAQDATATLGMTPELDDALGVEELVEHAGNHYRPLVLIARREGEPVIAAIAALRLDAGAGLRHDPEVFATIAAVLIEHDDIDPLTCALG